MFSAGVSCNQKKSRNMRVKYLKLKNWFFLTIVGLLGFNACRSTKTVVPDKKMEPRVPIRDEIILMYGVPTANFQIKGKVTDRNGKPVEGAQILWLDRGMEATPDSIEGSPESVRNYIQQNAVHSGSDGSFSLSSKNLPTDTIRLQVRDTDGQRNKKYKSQLKSIPVSKEEYKEGKGWFTGKVDKSVTIQMEEE